MAEESSAVQPGTGQPESAAQPGTARAGVSGSGARGSNLALYRKYRPATFAEVRGQEHVTDPLRQALKNGRINHAYLFSGPRGCGKTSSARILARSLNCVNGPTPDPCGECDSCVALAPAGPGSIDVIEIDAASHGGVDDARDLRDRAFFAPVSGRYKIYIIDEAHMVSPQGFNALLKLVEEPPAHLRFIFATTEPDKVIATIRSRTHHYPFRLMPPSVMSGLCTDILNDEGVLFEDTVIPLVVQAGGGSARDTLSILDQLLAGSDERGIRYDRAVALLGYTDASLLDEIVAAFQARDNAGVFRVVNKVIEGGNEPRRFATDLLDRFRDLIVLASVPDAVKTGLLNQPPDREDTLVSQAGWGLAELTRAAEIVSNGLDQMRGATSPRLLLELMCAQVLLPAAATDDRSILVRLARLESGAVSTTANPASSERPVASPQAPATAPRQLDPSEVPPAPPMPAPVAPARPARSQPAPEAAPVPEPAPTPAEPPRGQVPGRPAPAPGQRPAPPSPSSSTPPSRTGGALTTESIKQDWPGVLEMIKAKRRVAWMVLQNATVVSLDENVLMLRFPRQGDVKGFTSAKYDEVVKQALNARYGVNLVVRAISGPGTGPSGGGSRRPAPPSPPAPASPAPAPPAPAPAPARRAHPQSDAPWPDEPPPEDQPEPTSGGEPLASERPASRVPAPSPARPEREQRDDTDFDPNAEDSSAGVAAELTGVGLIQRELGGEIIGEFED